MDQGRPKHARKDFWAFVSVWIYLGLLAAVAHIYRVEGRAFEIVLWTTLAALPVYELVPFRLKKPTLSLAAIIGMACIYGRDTAICALGFTSAMVALARASRLTWQVRAGTLAAIAVSLAIVKSYGGLGALPPTFWPVAGTMLMFRLMLYMYELKHAKGQDRLRGVENIVEGDKKGLKQSLKNKLKNKKIIGCCKKIM
jgi:hypothetical protein